MGQQLHIFISFIPMKEIIIDEPQGKIALAIFNFFNKSPRSRLFKQAHPKVKIYIEQSTNYGYAAGSGKKTNASNNWEASKNDERAGQKSD